MSCQTTWTTERKPGGAWFYDELGLTYDGAEFDTIAVFYEALGEATAWVFEEPIDGCLTVSFLDFQDGTAATFQDGQVIQFN